MKTQMPEQLNEVQQRAFVCRMAQELRNKGSWCGETHLQKAAYIAKAVCGIGLYDFDLYLHGPYSFDFKTDLLRMQADGFLRPRFVANHYGPTLEVDEEAAENLMSECANGNCDSAIGFVAEWFGDKGVSDLEKLATAHFVSEKNRDKSNDEMAVILSKIKPHIDHQAALAAIDEVVRKEDEWREISR